MIVDVHEGRLDAKIAAGVTPLLNTLLRALGAADLEKRILDLEKQIKELERPLAAAAGIGS